MKKLGKWAFQYWGPLNGRTSIEPVKAYGIELRHNSRGFWINFNFGLHSVNIRRRS